jgi:hypothetical protein
MTIFHMKQSIAGCLRNNPVGTIDFSEDSEGKPLSDAEARITLNKLLSKGHTVMPVGDDCEGFDVFGGGCPGHEPLTGSDLTHAMLKRGDKAIMCGVGVGKSFFVVVTGIEFGKFLTSTGAYWLNPVPINNQGELLTAKEVGL